MASEPVANGNTATTDNGLTPAEKLMKMHAEDHHAYVEEVPDVDAAGVNPTAAPSLPVTTAPSPDPASMSAKAAGKQPMREEQSTAGAPKSRLDTASEEAFPALGGPKTQAAASAPTPWSKKPAAVGKAANGANGLANNQAPSNKSSRTGTAQSGMMMSSTPAPASGGSMQLPGRHKEAVTLPRQMMTPANQLKKPIAEILRDISKRSKATITHREGTSGLILEGTGPTDAVRVALKEAANQLCQDQKIRVPIPSSIRGRIVGKQGATIQAISKRTGAKINISKQEAAAILEEDEDSTIDVQIEGDPFAVQMAKQDIERIVAEHTSTVNSKLKHVPAEYYPFLAAQQNARMSALRQQHGQNLKMQIPQYHTWSRQAPPEAPANRQPISFAPQADLPIHVSGDREAVAQARAEIDRQIQELQRQLTLEQMAMERNRHQFIVGDMGSSLQDFMAETGCSVILPPDHDDSEMITIVGPADRIQEATDKIYDLASQMQSANADIAKQFASAPRGAQAHVRDMTRYLHQRQALAELERTHNARIVPDSTGNWQIYAPDQKTAMKARTDVMNLVSGHPPTRFQPVDVDPFYHSHLREQAASHIRETHGVRLVVPDEHGEPVLLVFEGREPQPEYQLPRKQPTSQEVQAFQQALQEAQQYILNLMNGHSEIVDKDVEAPIKFHDKIRRHVDKHHQGLPDGQIPVQVNYGGQRQPGQQRSAQAPNVNLRGPQDFVDALNDSLLAFIQQEHQDELERGFTLSFDFPQKHANHLIGQRGSNINRLREEFDVDIQLDDGKCTLKGPEAKANACKKHILEWVKKLEDEANHQLNIPQQYHRELIGAGGAQIRRLQERYGVRIDFPRTNKNDDDASEVADKRSQQQPNVVVVKGPSRGADQCRDELLSLLEYLRANSHNDTVSVAQGQLPSLIGSGGKEMESLRLETGASIDVPNSRDAAGPNGRVEIKLKGSKKAVEDAKKIILARSKEFDDSITRNLDIERRHHRIIIGREGATLRQIVTQAGGPEEPRQYNRMIRFPKTEAEGNNIRVEGQRAIVEQICSAIEALVKQQESQKNDTLDVPTDKHRVLIGKGGEARRQLEQKFKVQINIPRQGESGPVRIAGQPEDVEQAKAHILEITKDQEGETVQIPRGCHHSIANNGQFFRNLRNNHQVTVDHAGQRPPPKPAAPTPNRAAGGAAPLITDDPSENADNHHWETHDLHGSNEDGEIPWVLSGPSPEALTAARTKLEKALADAQKQDTMGFLILPDPRAHRHIIGQGGSVINRIRKQSGANIQVPKDQTQGEAIQIMGDKEGVEAARQAILEVLANAS
ncbi:hypothetical protein LTR78_006093 [Recurvomyces mirabilis]|uniref:K Homology domain-containing protein n=1 Tax=Recurvomyces mirabilis TaxID=574656 RepID=A0AAE0WLH1_9PEZI|nr:hypothetical protein LTR78_006093 [Recurvomyces mirabilis]KAK5151936.1 hypothetical protein LTS14_008710 [Recurvomyces mirabilis]